MFGSCSRSSLAWLALSIISAATAIHASYNIGAAEVNFMGYANIKQRGTGLRQRIYSRAFIVHDTQSNKRVVHITTDTAMIGKIGADLYTRENIMITGTHSHSGPAGFLGYLLYDLTALGWIEQSAEAIVTGIVLSIERAHERLQPGSVSVHVGELLDAGVNRSPSSYELNPAEERARYQHNTDKDMTLLRFNDASGKGIGQVNWFATHGTSMNNTNTMVTGDNKGYIAAVKFEQAMNPPESPTGMPNGFVAAFSQTNMGDVSPNTEGAKCLDTGLPYFGPGWREGDFASNAIIGDRQYEKARELFDSSPRKVLSGPVDFQHMYLDMSKANFTYANGTAGHTCPPAMGYSMAAGTTDGPGQFDFYQGQNTPNPLWNTVGAIVTKAPSKEQAACHYPKPILLNTGETHFPYEWQPTIVELQVFRVAEFTTMSGRRMREAVKKAAIEQGIAGEDTIVIVSGPSNTYASYTTTPEEYVGQRYEAGSTIFGPGSLPAYIQNAVALVGSMAKGTRLESAPAPPDFSSKFISLQTGVVLDSHPTNKPFGTVSDDVQPSYRRGNTVSVTFWTGHPRNNLLLEESYISVERQDPATKEWKRVRDDGYWSTRYKWVKVNGFGENKAVIEWDIEPNTKLGTYRIQHFGHHRTLFQKIVAHNGTSSTFQVIA
ncbi:Neutral/alkaline nonlysosomal ceramidase [Syncephalis plumigaleata]|nr:Neutral/alkaline nonlysosomal ceramidase [Syncephalis plumigaleata]